MSVHRIAVVAFDRISSFHLSVPCLVFEQRQEPGFPAFELRVCAVEPGPLSSDAGFDITPAHGLDGLLDADTVIVPSWRDPHEVAPEALCQALRAAHAGGARVIGLCLGTFVLADAGLLDGRPATTHWAALETFAGRYPSVRLAPDVLYVDDGDVMTSAGTVAGIDCCLHLVRRLHGAEVANRIARRLVVAPHREGGQTQYIERPLPTDPADARLRSTLEWACMHLHLPLNVDALAARSKMTRRTFTRRFRASLGTSLGEWVLAQRLMRAQRLLETTDHVLERVASDSGFGSAISLRQHFGQAFGVSPSFYRRSFRRS